MCKSGARQQDQSAVSVGNNTINESLTSDVPMTTPISITTTTKTTTKAEATMTSPTTTSSVATPMVAVVIPRSHSNVVPSDINDVPTEMDQLKEEVSKSPLPRTTPVSRHNPSHRHNNMDDAYIGVIIGTLTALILLLAGLAVYFMMRRRRKEYNHTSLKVFTTDDLTYIPSAKLANGNVYNAVATAEQEFTLQRLTAETQLQTRQLPEPPGSCDATLRSCDATLRSCDTTLRSKEVADNEVNVSRDYVTTELSGLSPLMVTLPPSPIYQSTFTPDTVTSRPHTDPQRPPTPPPPPHTRALPPATDQNNIQGWSGNSKYAVTNADAIWQEQLNIVEFPRQVLKFVEKLGQGQFGEIHLCEADDLVSFLPEDVLQSVDTMSASKSLLVAVKILRHDVKATVRCDFHQEVKILSCLKDPNIVRVLGVCSQGEPLAVVMEYMKYGDLCQFLSMHVLDTPLNQHKKANLLSYGCLMYMATQIASGMKYLETLNMVHRDLATRNCLVGHLYTIKISDFGMSRGLYKDDYYSIDGKAVLPVRWMAWESVLLDKFSCKSDVWSFAVTLWEVLTFARDRPYGNYGNEQVLENCGHYYRGDGQHTALPQPPNCPKEIYDLMVECCHRDESLRPTFREIHMFLSRKNMGYDPQDEKPMRYALGYI